MKWVILPGNATLDWSEFVLQRLFCMFEDDKDPPNPPNNQFCFLEHTYLVAVRFFLIFLCVRLKTSDIRKKNSCGLILCNSQTERDCLAIYAP